MHFFTGKQRLSSFRCPSSVFGPPATAGRRSSVFGLSKTSIMKKITTGIFAITILFYAACSNSKQDPNDSQDAATRFVNPPLQGVNVPFREYKFKAEEGDTLFYPSGSIVLFPPNSLLDKNGKIVSGEVKVIYREFADPVDFFVSGIPMNYDSAGKEHIFESSAMCEINAYQGRDPLFVNPKIRPEVNLASANNDPAHNLYFLDTAQRKWVGRGKDVITDVSKISEQDEKNETSMSLQTVYLDEPAPVKPLKASGERPNFVIDIPENHVAELQAYHNLKFEIHPDQKNYDPKEADIIWDNVKIENGKKAGTYLVTFINTKQQVTYLTRPVFEGADYDAALKIFEQRNKKYQKWKKERLAMEQNENWALETRKLEMEKLKKEMEQQNEQTEKENKKTEKLNALIVARNRQLEELNIKILANNRELERRQRVQELAMLMETEDVKPQGYDKDEYAEALRMAKEKQERIKKNAREANKTEFEEGGMKMFGSVIRTFQLEGFGVWNTDYPVPLNGRGAISLEASFYDNQNKPLELKTAMVVYKGFNGISVDHGPTGNRFNNLKVIPGKENMIWGVLDNSLHYITYEDFKNSNITGATQEHTFKMRTHPDKITSAEDLRKVLDL
jgi:hypothetical protein